MPSHISAGWLIWMPDVIFHEDAVEPVIAAPKPPWVDYTPSSVRDNFSDTNAIVLETLGNPIFTRAHRTGSGSGLVTGVFSGDLAGGFTGSRVGGTGSSRGMTVYLLMGSPICATADLPWWMARKKFPPERDVRQLVAGIGSPPKVNKERGSVVTAGSILLVRN